MWRLIDEQLESSLVALQVRLQPPLSSQLETEEAGERGCVTQGAVLETRVWQRQVHLALLGEPLHCPALSLRHIFASTASLPSPFPLLGCFTLIYLELRGSARLTTPGLGSCLSSLWAAAAEVGRGGRGVMLNTRCYSHWHHRSGEAEQAGGA